MDSQPSGEASFSEFFKSLREEAEFFVRANKPPCSIRARRLSPGEDGLQARVLALERENLRLAAQVKQLEAENHSLRIKRGCPSDSTDKYANRLAAALNRLEGRVSPVNSVSENRSRRGLSETPKDFEWLPESLPTSMTGTADDIKVLDLNLQQPEEETVDSLKDEVAKHKAFIHHLKRSLQDLLIERLQEREDHLRTKSRLDQLLRSLKAA